MWHWIQELDQILRGEKTSLPALREGRLEIPAIGLSAVIVILGLLYGVCMGTYAIFRDGGPCYDQTLASTVKVPALFVLTLIVTFPSLYVFNALVGSRLTILPVLRLLIASLAVNLAVLSSLGPIVAFFSVNTTSYPFMVLLNVAVFALSGVLGLTFLLQTLHRLSIAQGRQPPLPLPPGPADTGSNDAEPNAAVVAVAVEEPGALDRATEHVLGKHVKAVFGCWVVVFGLVGAQMGWVLRPFIGDPNLGFQWFRPRGSNFFESVWQSMLSLIS
ncbi:MAG: hypothetical protein JXB62_19000 [Pirellulales bacterium]|nr:hypothetical protein [Pirellulales bacterium]